MFRVPSTVGPGSYLTLRVLSPPFGADLSGATDLETDVLRQDGSETSFDWTINGATAGELIAQYQFTGSEFTGTGLYRLAPKVTTPNGVLPAYSVALYVSSPFQLASAQQEESTWIAASWQISPTSAAVSQRWFDAHASQTLSPFWPWVRCNSGATHGGANAPISLTLWTPNDGDYLVLADAFGAAAAHNVTLAASGAGDEVPTGVGTFGASVVYSIAGFVSRIKFDKVTGLWLPW